MYIYTEKKMFIKISTNVTFVITREFLIDFGLRLCKNNKYTQLRQKIALLQ